MTDAKKPNATQLAIRPFVPAEATDAEWTDYHAYCNIRRQEDWPDRPLQTDANRKRELLKQWPLGEQVEWLAEIDGRIVGNIWMSRRRASSAA